MHTLHSSHHTCMMYVTTALRGGGIFAMSAFAPAPTTGVPEAEIDRDRSTKHGVWLSRPKRAIRRQDERSGAVSWCGQ